MNRILNIKSHKNFLSFCGIAVGIGIGSYFSYRSYLNNKINYHPTKEIAEMAIRLDKRISNFCGKNYKIDKYSFVDDDGRTITYRIYISGMRGDCKALVKAEKVTHEYLKQVMENQIEYTKLTKQQKAASPFTPINFNDIIVPTEETNDKIKNALGDNSEILTYNKDKFSKGFYNNYNVNTDQNNVKIDNEDTFYKINTIVLVAGDSLVFNIRPIGPKHRDYEIEDTVYKNSTYLDVLKQINEMKYKYDEVVEENCSQEELKNEIMMQKHTKFQSRLETRKKVIIFNILCAVLGLITFRYFTSHSVDLAALSVLNNLVLKNKNLLSKLGDCNLVAISYRFDPFIWKYRVKGLIQGVNGNAKITANVEISNKNHFKNVQILNMNNEKLVSSI